MRPPRRALVPSCLALVLAAGAAAATTATAADDPAALLARAKQAAGGAAWDRVRILHTRGRVETGGLAGDADSWNDLRTGRFLDAFTLGPARGAEGYDGTLPWSQDSSGKSRVDDGGDAREGSVDEAYRRSLSYWYPDRRPGTIALLPAVEEKGKSFRVLEILPRGGRRFELWLDGETLLVDRVIERRSRDTETTFYSDYRTVSGLKVPFASRRTRGEPRYDLTTAVDGVELDPPFDEARFARPDGRTADFAIAGGAASAEVPFELVNNHLYVQVRLNGGAPLSLLFDSGGENLLTPEAARRAGLAARGALEGRGVGEKSEDAGLVRVAKVELGAVSLSDQLFAVLPLSGLDAAEGRTVDGLVGYEVFQRFAVRIDYGRKAMTLTLADRFAPPAGVASIPFTFDDQTPQVEGEIDGIPGRFTLDTGSRTSLTLHRPFAEAHRLAERYRPKVTLTTGWGIGGGVRAAVARAGMLKLGGVAIAAPVVEIPETERGSFAGRYLAGNVGGALLRHFTVTFDYPHQRLYLEPSGVAAPDGFDRAGLWLNRDGDAFVVMDVAAGTPAAEADLAAGDRVTAVDGESAAGIALWQLREILRGRPGTRVRLTVRRGGEEREATVLLRELL